MYYTLFVLHLIVDVLFLQANGLIDYIAATETGSFKFIKL